MTDQMVLQTQQWLNKTYGNDPRFKKINPDGRTGWPTIYALTRALQIELGVCVQLVVAGWGWCRFLGL